ncbi:dual specificity protein phosphatase family protein [Mesobacillus sp. AQ2]|uniref:protein-tyrosine phosphatase family protein n=1 Tax=Mesobacillus sp. AQ2 TaxID=3043332 RepID=UPI0024C1064C|nr:dual specificity protein phosphatase family protein [Mesobacillus sp. AQ2]WHX41391.1 dual specificity protein phosphatase family protein [Mesobacillus sp. AQ2]
MNEQELSGVNSRQDFYRGRKRNPRITENEKIDMVYDLRAENKEGEYEYPRTHLPMFDNDSQQDESVKKAMDEVATAYESGKNIYFHCSTGRTRTGTLAAGTLLKLNRADSIEEAKSKAREVREVLNLDSQLITSLERIFPEKK